MTTFLLETDEIELGAYKIQRVDWESGEWFGTGYWVRAVVTNRRLVIYPEQASDTGNRRIVHASDIRKVWNVCLKGRDGVLISLKNRTYLYMLVEWSQGSKLTRDIKFMLFPPVQPRILPRLLTY